MLKFEQSQEFRKTNENRRQFADIVCAITKGGTGVNNPIRSAQEN
jgi:hypothetical protein